MPLAGTDSTVSVAPALLASTAMNCVATVVVTGPGEQLELPLAQALELEAFSLELSSRSLDFREGLAAFRDKRDPRYQGR